MDFILNYILGSYSPVVLNLKQMAAKLVEIRREYTVL
jgi:hypothetical protein